MYHNVLNDASGDRCGRDVEQVAEGLATFSAKYGTLNDVGTLGKASRDQAKQQEGFD